MMVWSHFGNMAQLLRNAQQNVNFIIGPLLGNLLLPKLPSLILQESLKCGIA